jgi:hypothetical protein
MNVSRGLLLRFTRGRAAREFGADGGIVAGFGVAFDKHPELHTGGMLDFRSCGHRATRSVASFAEQFFNRPGFTTPMFLQGLFSQSPEFPSIRVNVLLPRIFIVQRLEDLCGDRVLFLLGKRLDALQGFFEQSGHAFRIA